MGFFDNIFGSSNGKERTTRAAARRRNQSTSSSSSSNSRTAAGERRKAQALKKAAEARSKPRKPLPGSATEPKKTQAQKDASLRTNRQKAKAPVKAPAKAPAKPKMAPAKTVAGDRPKFGLGNNKTIMAKRGGKTVELANVSADQLKKLYGKSGPAELRKYMNAWNKTGKRPTK